MKFKLIGSQGRGTRRSYFVKGEGPWSMRDILPHMLEVSKHSRDYALNGQFEIYDKRDMEHRRASLTLERTLDPRVNRIKVFDMGVGKQMIEKYIRSVENEIEHPVSDEERLKRLHKEIAPPELPHSSDTVN